MVYIFENVLEIGELSLQHLQFVGISILIAIVLAVPQSILIWKITWLRVPLLGLMGIFYTKILAGSIVVTLLAWILNIGLQTLERYTTPSTPRFSKAESP
ncbi:MAG: hypothetical protein ACO3NK_09950 [Prochlorotrichaceae cyanobacterium]|jgi:osmoprotectant transport system permease protein